MKTLTNEKMELKLEISKIMKRLNRGKLSFDLSAGNYHRKDCTNIDLYFPPDTEHTWKNSMKLIKAACACLGLRPKKYEKEYYSGGSRMLRVQGKNFRLDAPMVSCKIVRYENEVVPEVPAEPARPATIRQVPVYDCKSN